MIKIRARIALQIAPGEYVEPGQVAEFDDETGAMLTSRGMGWAVPDDPVAEPAADLAQVSAETAEQPTPEPPAPRRGKRGA